MTDEEYKNRLAELGPKPPKEPQGPYLNWFRRKHVIDYQWERDKAYDIWRHHPDPEVRKTARTTYYVIHDVLNDYGKVRGHAELRERDLRIAAERVRNLDPDHPNIREHLKKLSEDLARQADKVREDWL